MPYNDADTTDPMSLHGVIVETQDGRAIYDMADCLVEEYTRLRFDADRVLRMFKTPGYAGPFLAYRALGEEVVRSLITEHAERRRPRSCTTPPEHRANGDIALPVLESNTQGDSHVIGV